MREASPLWLRLAIALVTIILALGARLGYDITRTADPETGHWVSVEADSFYHMRRVDRLATEGWPVAGEDDLLDFPDGAQIPWPPYYTMLLGALTLPWLSEDAAERRLEIEQFVASITVLFGVLSALLAVWSARLLAGDRAAAFAGPCAALALCAVVYSSLGNGDHHAFVACLHALLLAGLTWTIASESLERPQRAKWLGIVLGALAGFGIGSWVAFLPYVVEVDLVLAVLLFQQTRRPIPGLANFGFAFHLAAIVVLAYGVVTSPWLAVDPWLVVNLSYFHLFFLALGAAVFVPLLLPGTAASLRARYPWFVLGGLVVIAGVLMLFENGPGAGLREAFAWASGEDEFMASIQESRSFFDSVGEGWTQLLMSLGWGVVLLPIAWLAGVVAWRRGSHALLPWLVAAPLLLLQSLSQLRFAEALVVPMAVLVGWGVAVLLGRVAVGSMGKRLLGVGLALVLGVAVQQPGIAEVLRYREASKGAFEATEVQASFGSARRICDWLHEREVIDGRAAVLSTWGFGHMLEWVAERPTIATNFGSYLGDASYSFPPRALLSESDEELEELLDERGVGFVLLTSRTTENLPDMIARAKPELRSEYLAGSAVAWTGALKPRWFETSMARLLLGASKATSGVPPSALRPIGFLRLVHVARERDPAPALRGLVDESPRGWIWEYVEGARLEASGEPGAEFGVKIELNYPKASWRTTFVDRVVLDADGRGSLRVPYATVGTNGDGRALPGAEYWIGDVRGRLLITEEMVLSGIEAQLP